MEAQFGSAAKNPAYSVERYPNHLEENLLEDNTKPIDACETSGNSPTTGPAATPANQDTPPVDNNGNAPPTGNGNAAPPVGNDDVRPTKGIALIKRWRKRITERIIKAIEDRKGKFVIMDDELWVVDDTTSGVGRYNLDGIQFDQVIFDVVGITRAEYDYKVIREQVRLTAAKKATRVKCGFFSLCEGPHGTDPNTNLIVAHETGLLRIKPGNIDYVRNTQYYYVETVGLPWKYKRLTGEGPSEAAQKFKEFFADAQARAPQGRMALALAAVGLPYFRQALDTKPVFYHSGPQGSGKTFQAEREGLLIYGLPVAQSATEAALRRSKDPLVILDDIEVFQSWLQDHLRRSSTGTRHQSVANVQGKFAVTDSGSVESIYLITGIRVPTDPPLLSRTWLFTFSKEYFDPKFKNEMALRESIKLYRPMLLSFMMELLSETLGLLAEGPLDLSAFDPLPAERTRTAQMILFRMLQAFDRLAPGIIDPQAEFAGFIDSLRREETTIKGLTTDETTLLAQILGPEAISFEGFGYENGFTIAPAEAISKAIQVTARQQGIRLRHSMNAVNVGKWLASEVTNSKEFIIEETTTGTGPNKRKAWRMSRKGNNGQD
jgi:hypothetical protein